MPIAESPLGCDGLSGTPLAGTGPGIEGGVENSGRASSRNEKAGTGEESSMSNVPGAAGAGGCGEVVNWTGCTSAIKEAGMAAKPAFVYSFPPSACEGAGCGSGSVVGSTKIGRASARNENGASVRPAPPWPGRPAGCAGTETADRASGAIVRSGVETYEPD